MTAIPTCPVCAVALHEHLFCVRCRRLHHEPCRDSDLCKGCDIALLKRGLRRCTIGGEVKPLAAFAKERGSTKHYRACRACRDQRPAKRAANKQYYIAHQEKRRAYGRAYYAEHQKARKAASKRWRVNNHPASIAAAARWRAANRDRHRANVRAWQANNRDRKNASARAGYQRQKLRAWFGPAATG